MMLYDVVATVRWEDLRGSSILWPGLHGYAAVNNRKSSRCLLPVAGDEWGRVWGLYTYVMGDRQVTGL